MRDAKALLGEDLLRSATERIERYTLVFEPLEGGAGFVSRAVEMPLVFADGATIQESYDALRDALTVAAGTMLEHGRTPPSPIQQERSLQINVRVKPDEKLLLEAAAQNYGLRSVSAFMRSAALMRAGASGPPLRPTRER